jgi:hypothetical protein
MVLNLLLLLPKLELIPDVILELLRCRQREWRTGVCVVRLGVEGYLYRRGLRGIQDDDVNFLEMLQESMQVIKVKTATGVVPTLWQSVRVSEQN